MTEASVVGIDIGGTRTRIGLMRENGSVVNFQMAFTDEVLNGEHPINSFLEYIDSYLKSVNEVISKIVIGVPSTLSKDRKTVLSTPNISCLNNIRLAELVTKKTNIPAFTYKDVNLLLYNDCLTLGLKNEGIVLACYIGTGFGNAIMINGSFLQGKHGVACELGHIPMYHGSETCVCGNKGCAETIASGRALEKIKEKYYTNISFEDLFIREYKDSNVLHYFIDDLSLPIAAEINIFDPDHLILGGGVVNMPGFPKKDLEEAILRHTRKPFPGNDFELHYTDGQGKNGVLGACRFGFSDSYC